MREDESVLGSAEACEERWECSQQGSRLGHSPAREVTSRGLEELSLCVCKLPGVHLMDAGVFVHKPGGVSRCLL